MFIIIAHNARKAFKEMPGSDFTHFLLNFKDCKWDYCPLTCRPTNLLATREIIVRTKFYGNWFGRSNSNDFGDMRVVGRFGNHSIRFN